MHINLIIHNSNELCNIIIVSVTLQLQLPDVCTDLSAVQFISALLSTVQVYT